MVRTDPALPPPAVWPRQRPESRTRRWGDDPDSVGVRSSQWRQSTLLPELLPHFQAHRMTAHTEQASTSSCRQSCLSRSKGTGLIRELWGGPGVACHSWVTPVAPRVSRAASSWLITTL